MPAFASVSGQGKATAGVSYDEHQYNSGIDGSYLFVGKSLYQNYSGAVMFEEVADDDSVSPIVGHSYLYAGDSRSATLNHQLTSENPYFSINTDASYSENGDVAIADNTNWLVRTGPRYARKVRSDITIDAQYFHYRQKNNDYISQQDDSSLALRKSIKGNTELSIEYLYSCINYADTEVVDYCKDRYSLSLKGDYGDAKYDARLSRVDRAENRNTTYEVNYSYFLNSANNLSAGYKKEDTAIPARVLLITDGNMTSDPVITTTARFKYIYSYRRLKFDVENDSIKYEVLDITKSEKKFRAAAEYMTSGALCQSCYLVTGFDQSHNEVMDWYSYSLGVSIPFKREWSREFSLRKTVHEDGESILSLNFLLKYDGQAAVISR